MKLVHLLRRLVSLTNSYSRSFSLWSWLISAYSSNSLSLDLGWCRCHTEHTDCAHLALSQLNATPSLPQMHLRDEQHSPGSPPPPSASQDTIHRLMSNPTLFDPVRAPRYPIVLCHGLYGFDVRGPAAFPSLRLHYWSSVLSILKHKLGAEVIVTGVPSTGSVASRAESLDHILQQRSRGRGINLVAHSMGGLDCRHLITSVRPTEYVPLSLTSVSTPHRGSPFMDWCAQYLGLGRRQDEPMQRTNDPERQPRPDLERETVFPLSLSNFPSSFTTLLLSLIDSPAYANLTTSYLENVFNPSTPDDPRVKYFSVASRIDEMSIWHPLWFPKMVLDDAERTAKERLKAAAGHPSTYASYSSSVLPWEEENEWGNDGLVTVQSARWGEFLGILDACDHWEIRGARRMEMNVELPSGIGNITHRVTGEGWDWSRFVSAWKKQEKGASGGLELAQATGIVASDDGDNRQDPVVKASTDKLSAVFDWIVEHVPSTPKERLPSKKTTKFDLERFYVALTRRLYDEGL